MRIVRIILIVLFVLIGGLVVGFSTALAWHAWRLPSTSTLTDRYEAAGAPTRIADISLHVLAALEVVGGHLDYHLARQECVSRDALGLQYHIQSAFCGVAAMVYYSDDEIRLWWLNSAYLGREAYGITQASSAYFGKPQSDLSAAEAAVLISLTFAPSDVQRAIDRVVKRYGDRLGLSREDVDLAAEAILKSG